MKYSIILFFTFIFFSCKSQEEKRNDYLQSDEHKKSIELLENENLAKLKRYRFEEDSIRPIQKNIMALEGKLSEMEALGLSPGKLFPIKDKIRDLKILIAERENHFLVEQLRKNESE